MSDMFRGQNSYDFPPPRECQTRAIESLRAGLRAGHKNQLLVLPTGGGKSIASLMLIAEALKRGRRASFVCDRITLINQISENADKYGMQNHGIVQAEHWRRDNSLPFQIASVQTIQARGYWPDSDLVVIDEAHVLHAAHKELLESKRVPVIGLTATPCTKGLGKYFTNVVNAATMNELTEAGVLVPMRIFSCTAPDMKGAKTSGGEWTPKAASEREAKIIGDVVAEWMALGENRKTIAFGADIAYCRDLVKRFTSAGVYAAEYTSETSDEECAQLLKEFRKPDSQIRILVSVEKLAKGFDVPDVSCVIDARPLRKSLSTAIQMWGRGLRSSPGKADCLARGTLVLTDRGEIPIESVTLADKVWDGVSFVRHEGAVCKGVQAVITYDGITATPDHEVMTDDGWKTLEAASCGQIRIVRTGIGGQPIRFSDDHLQKNRGLGRLPEGRSSVRHVRGSSYDALREYTSPTANSGLPGRRNHRTVENSFPQAEREVWDILNAGPLQRFTANGRLVHNCLLLDHTRNIVRFMRDFEEVYYNGFQSLDESEKLDAKPREDEQGEAQGCPQCSRKPFNRRCIACGYEKQTIALEDTTRGVMQEITIGNGKSRKVLASNAEDLWQQLCAYARVHSREEKQAARARNLFRNITGNAPPPHFNFYSTPSAAVSKNTRNKIKQLDWAWREGQKKSNQQSSLV